MGATVRHAEQEMMIALSAISPFLTPQKKKKATNRSRCCSGGSSGDFSMQVVAFQQDGRLAGVNLGLKQEEEESGS